MAAYVIVDVKVTDPETYERYKAGVPPTLAKYGGRFLVRGGKRKSWKVIGSPAGLSLLSSRVWKKPKRGGIQTSTQSRRNCARAGRLQT